MSDSGEKPEAGAAGPDAAGERVQSVLQAAERAASEILADATQEAQRRVSDARDRAEQVGRERVEMMSALSDALLEQATTVKRQTSLLIEALDRVIASLELELEKPIRQTAPAPSPKPRAPSPPPPPPSPPARPMPAAAPAPQNPPSEARQRALTAIRERIARGVEEAQRAQAPASPPPPPAPRPAPPAPRPVPQQRPVAQRPKEPARSPRKKFSEQAAEGARILATQMAVAGSTRAEILMRLRKEFGIEDPERIVDGVVDGPPNG